jgi:hypothetical protein
VPIRRLLPSRVRRFYVAHRSAVGFTFLFVCFIASLAITKADSDAQDRAIQASRVEVAKDNCRSQNERHDNTVRQLDNRIAELSGRERARADRNRDFTVSLIEALAPKRNCKALVEQIRSAAN